MASLLGWKDILRPIRDGYRHLFPTPDTGPTPEERRHQRALDRLKGFAYFDTFDQLESWTDADSDPLKRANTPLLRATGGVPTDDRKTGVLLIHDYSGNYHDYESVQAVGVDKELYSCEYLQFVDTFVYFSHKLVCVPPPTWTNTLHRNGVEALGTFLIERQTEGSERVFNHTTEESGEMNFPMAKKLAFIATHFGFDGWLINIEKPFPSDVWNSEVLEAFLRQLRDELGVTKRLIWYDALTTSNKISYQNALTSSNLKYADACENLLTNYCWTDVDVSESIKLGTYTNYLGDGKKIYFGVDVWAQNKSSFTHPRVTYPEYGGGGTNTGVALAKTAEYGLSVGIFAPAWSFEHFPGHERDVERTVWEGTSLPESIECTCGDCTSRHPPNKDSPILHTAKERVAGSEHFFYTDFTRAFSTHDDDTKHLFNNSDAHSQLGSQSVLPRPASILPKNECVTLSHHIEHSHNRNILVISFIQEHPNEDCDVEAFLPLYKLDMPADGSLQLAMVLDSYEDPRPPEMEDMTFFVYFKSGRTMHYHTLHLSREPIVLLDDIPRARIEELGVRVKGPLRGTLRGPVRLIGFKEICISSTLKLPPSSSFSIKDVRVEKRGEGVSEHVRLCWNYEDAAKSESKTAGMPWSDITGPFAHFTIRSKGLLLAKAYALEHILNEKFVEGSAGQKIEVEVTGIGFDGRKLAETQVALQL
ncbi:uncharacterized protein J4E88_002560 [Alternaria novae-zelandiae]|uniref:uncharacterized protein n=1 Tax=Alternaria novae-zelandiae TaxID=430562 RepID=UPI0020C2805A|nr:uncharacterized protein J4E88_002560 [Alternaria novae-zelandiae]KAI4689211.1 hypothetical protein J4E88_002560 [Alternaria novae-zelandiae]